MAEEISGNLAIIVGDIFFEGLKGEKREIGQRVYDKLKARKSPVGSFTCAKIALERFPKSLAPEDVFASTIMNCDLYENLAKYRPANLGDFSIGVSGWAIHPECPIQLEIHDSKQHRIATIGFFLQTQAGGKTTVHINNIQGIKGKANVLNQFSKQVGENWRVWVARRIKMIAQAKKAETIGVLPSLFWLFGPESSPESYRRQIRQYRQTFRKAGIKNIDVRLVKPYPEKYRALWKKVKTRRGKK